ncbi:phosphoribosylglycinamide formyltransferase [Desertibacillus haloalkaliphilus]|uniref:phosphoribosylglycinamide formyltransferase n=1 Tax=Desertibacillus haloalkaliphilus TaxID=1328930 RepID=UPI001C27D4C7|nr:phosphoribosylglycinamide formyltransferase [Desertibacillus haloalkaliphilus]MBU8906393.1 phosphoribosylglycinamide formyltransferase [Desertibacillus haloalkaliphilus]
MKKIAVFASGTGSNFSAIIDAVHAGQLAVDVKVLICDRPHAKVIEKAKANGIPTFTFTPKQFEGKQAYEQEILRELKAKNVEFIALAGYMRLVGETLLKAYEGKIVNIHPSLLPAFPGKDAIGQAFQARVKVTGVTIHFVDEGMDTGPIIAQEAVKIDEQDKIEDVTKKIQTVEHQLYPKVLKELLEDKRLINQV